jgi:MFS family permease
MKNRPSCALSGRPIHRRSDGAIGASERSAHAEQDGRKQMTGKLDWKWIGIGVVVMLVLNLIAGLILGLALGPQMQEVTTPADLQLTSGQAVLAAVLNFLAFAIGGFIVGLKSAGRTILEPGISAAIAVVIALLISGNFTLGNIIAGGLVPFIAGVLGGWLGERRQGVV